MVKPYSPNPWRDPQVPIPNIRPQLFAEARINLGMITDIDSADIENGALQLAQNAMVRYDRTSRRYGSSLFSDSNGGLITKPDAEKVLKVVPVKLNDGTNFLLRFTPTSVHKFASGVFTNLTLAGGITLDTDPTRDRYQIAVVLGTPIFSNNGTNELRKIDAGLNEIQALGNAPAYRYVTGFFNRVVGAALKDTNEVEIGWSGEAGYNNAAPLSEWNNLVDVTAGKTVLIESPADLGDFITGIFGFTNVMVIMRERSVWVAQKQPIPELPFHFQSVIPGIGSDCPHSVQMIDNAIVWADRRTKGVYAFSPGGEFERLSSLKIEKRLFNAIDDPDFVFSGYDSIEGEYHICVPLVTGKIGDWTYNRKTKTWAYNEYEQVSTIDTVSYGLGGTTIDELGDVEIDSLLGIIDDLSPTSTDEPVVVRGLDDGEIEVVDPTQDTDAGKAYTTYMDTKVFQFPEVNMLFAEIRLEFVQRIQGQIELYYTKDSTDSATWTLLKTIIPTQLDKTYTLKFKRAIRTKRIAFRLKADTGIFDWIRYEVDVYPSGDSRD